MCPGFYLIPPAMLFFNELHQYSPHKRILDPKDQSEDRLIPYAWQLPMWHFHIWILPFDEPQCFSYIVLLHYLCIYESFWFTAYGVSCDRNVTLLRWWDCTIVPFEQRNVKGMMNCSSRWKLEFVCYWDNLLQNQLWARYLMDSFWFGLCSRDPCL